MIKNLKDNYMATIFSICLVILISSSAALAGSVKLAWEKPGQNTDGTQINDLAGYKIYYSDTSSASFSTSIDVGNTTSYRVKDLRVDRTYYFAVTAYDFSGNESAPSNEVSLVASNKSPASPKPISPGKGKKNVSTSSVFTWQQSPDPDGDTVTYDLIICEDPSLTSSCMTQTNIASVNQEGVYYAGIGGLGGGFLLFGMVIAIIKYMGTKKNIFMWAMPILLFGLFLLISCGSHNNAVDTVTSNGGEASQVLNEPVTGLKSNTTYYWQVIARDGSGAEAFSDVWSFQTL